MKKIIALIVACLLAVSIFAGCGGSNTSETTAATEAAATDAAADDAAAGDAAANADATAIEGTWTTTSYIDAEGNEYTLEEYAEKYSTDVETITVSYTFNADGTAKCAALGAEVEGTYTFDGTTIQTTFEGSAPVFEYDADNGVITNSEDPSGVVSVFSKS